PLPARVTAAAVRSYRTISPLPAFPDVGQVVNLRRVVNPPRVGPINNRPQVDNLPYIPRNAGGIFSVALSVKPALSESPRPLAGMLPYGDRTFLPITPPKAAFSGDYPSREPNFHHPK